MKTNMFKSIKQKIKRFLVMFLYEELITLYNNDIANSKIEYLKESKITIGNNSIIDKTAIIKIIWDGKITIGDRTSINLGVCLMTYGGDIEIGNDCDINPYTIIYGHGNTRIGNHVLIAGHCMIIPNNHNIKDTTLPIAKQGNNARGIIIEDDVWIGHGCSILDGVTIGKGSVIAAGSVVNKSVPQYSIVGGVPCKIIRSRLDKNI